ncbi:MAG: MFS transporter [Bifidobacteriaceae bacterium]|jgi:MFS family permease|nr:MFS transporter [Bifidobacteriaceae bacterium]
MPRNVWILSLIALGVAIGFGVVNPVLPVFASSFAVDEFAAGAVVAAFALMRLLFAPAVGFLTDRLGHRLVLLSGILIVALSSVGVGLAQSYPAMLLARGAGGAGSAMFSVSAMTVLLASVEADRRGRASALYQGSFLVGAVAGPAVGGLFAAISLRAPFFFYAGTLVIAALVALNLEAVPGLIAGPGGRAVSRKLGTASSIKPRPLGEVLRDRRYQAALLAALAQGWNTAGARGALVPLFVAAVLASSPSQAALWTGLAMSLAAGLQMAAIWPSGWIVDRYGRRGPMVGGALVAGIAMVFLPHSPSIVWLTALLMVYALGAALIGTAPAAAVGDAAGPGATRAIAVFSMAGDTGAVLGPLVAGYLAAQTSYTAAFSAGAGLWLASAVTSWLMRPPEARA